MQFSNVVALLSVFAATSVAQYGGNATIPAVPAGPTGTGGAGGSSGNGTAPILTTPASPSSTDSDYPPTQYDNGAMKQLSGSALGLLVAGGLAFAL